MFKELDQASVAVAQDTLAEHSDGGSVWKPIASRRYSTVAYTQLPSWSNPEEIIKHRALMGAGLGTIATKRRIENGYIVETLLYKDNDFQPFACGD